MQICASRAGHGRREGAQPPFDLWRIPGCKRLDIGDAGILLTVSIGPRRARLLLGSELADGSAFTCTVPLTPQLRSKLDEFHAIAQLIDGIQPAQGRSSTSTRSGLLHLRALQALDAIQAGASHRDIAATLFGRKRSSTQWQADGSLRAQVRHLIFRAEGFMHGGYLDLAGVTGIEPAAPGDESLH